MMLFGSLVIAKSNNLADDVKTTVLDRGQLQRLTEHIMNENDGFFCLLSFRVE